MRKNVKILLLGSFLIGVIGLSQNLTSVTAVSRVYEASYFDVLIIDDAYYLDIDEDGYEDDCITIFTVYSPTGALAEMDVSLKLSIQLPSGLIFYFMYKFSETFTELELQIEWYNVAIEEGWYIFTVSMNYKGVDVNNVHFSDIATETLEFDPRDAIGGSLPFAIVRY